jgi:uncharacterized protein (DUF58 family)
MIVPTARLILWFGCLVLPALLVATAVPASVPAVAVLLALFVLFGVVDAARTFGVLEGLSVTLPDVIRLTKEREGLVEMQIKNDRPNARMIRVGLDAREELGLTTLEKDVLLPAEQALSKVEWECLPLERGCYRFDQVFLEAESPFGFWALRGRRALATEWRVYPNLLKERSGMAAMFLRRGQMGVHAQRQLGKGREFELLRDYVPGDGMDEISWKATARRGQPITRVFQIERTQEVYVIMDASRLSARRQVDDGGEGTTTLERYVTAALMLGLAAEQQGDLFGLMTFSDRVNRFLRARKGPAHFNSCRDVLYTIQPELVSPDLEELASFIRVNLRRRALLIFLTALDDPVLSESFVRAMEVLCRQHLVMVNMLPPPGVEPVFSSDDVGSVGEVYERLGGQLRWNELRELETTLHRRGVQFQLLEDERMCPQLVSQYVSVKRRQLL